LAAARRLASHVARLQANGTPSGAQYRHALRQVVGHCIYGVDLNPMAVELCKVSLWMEAVELDAADFPQLISSTATPSLAPRRN
jgi:hypothetical protein